MNKNSPLLDVASTAKNNAMKHQACENQALIKLMIQRIKEAEPLQAG